MQDAGTATDSNGTKSHSPSQLFAPLLEGNRGFTSTLWPNPSTFSGLIIIFGSGGTQTTYAVNVFGFCIWTRHVADGQKGWDSATGWGTPYGLASWTR